MPFTYKELTVTGSRADTEGTAKFIQEAKIFLESAGWTTFDDNSAAAAGSHLIAFSSTGETSSFPTFYIVLNSGTTTAQNSNVVSLQVSTDWDAGAHDEGAGVIAPSSLTAVSSVATDSNGDFKVWMSGDSEGVVFITRQGASTYDSACIGRANQFHSTAQDPFPLYINATSATAIIVENTSNVRGVVGNPPKAINANSDAEVRSIAFTANNQPYNQSGATSIYFAWPLVFTTDDITVATFKKGIIGTLRNAWGGAGSNAGMFNEGRLIASGTDFGKQVYRSFLAATTDSLIIREE